MIRRLAIFSPVLALIVATSASAQAPSSPRITDTEFAELTKLIDDTHDRLMSLITGLTDEQWNFHENPDRWSTAECVEHITRSEEAMLERVKTLITSEPDAEWHSRTEGKQAVLREFVPNPLPQGQGGVRAPDELEPTQKWDRQFAIERFYAVHGSVRSFVETMDRNIKDRTMESGVPAFNWLNAYDWLTLIPLHVERHSKQIAKIHADPNYPKKPAESAAAKQPDPNLTEKEFATLVEDIDVAQDTLLALITGMTDEQWNFRQNPDRWSVAECVEHIVRGETLILGAIQASPSNPNWYEETKGKNELVRQSVLNRNPGGAASPFKAPYEVAPTEKWERARGIQEFYNAQGAIRAYVETLQGPLKDKTIMNPFPQLGMLNAHDWLTLMALHVRRHSMQIAEVQADPNYPK